eukprot:764091-Hanusia_phi.AAC.10
MIAVDAEERLSLRGGADRRQIREYLDVRGPDVKSIGKQDFDEFFKTLEPENDDHENLDWNDFLQDENILKSFSNSDEERIVVDSHFGISSLESTEVHDSLPEENFTDPVYYSTAFPQCGFFGLLIEKFDEIIKQEPSSYNHSFALLRFTKEDCDHDPRDVYDGLAYTESVCILCSSGREQADPFADSLSHQVDHEGQRDRLVPQI